MSETPSSVPVPAPVAKARHDLRNALGTVLGCTDFLREEAAELGHSDLSARFQALCADAHQLLVQINETIDVEKLRQHPETRDLLGVSIAEFCARSVLVSEQLSRHCRALAGTPFLNDLDQIAVAARRMGESAPQLLGGLFESAHDLSAGRGFPHDVGAVVAGLAGDTIFLRKTGAQPPAPGTTGDTTTFAKRAAHAAAAAILVVDDNEANRALLVRRLGRHGHRVAQAEDGICALEMLHEHPFDLVLLDMLMPNMNGNEVLAAMKFDLALRHIPVIMITGVDDLANLIGCIEGGADDYLTKPFDPVLLDARIGACLEKKRLRDQEQGYLRRIEEEKRRADELLRVILPHSIALELQEHNCVKPQRHENVAVLFSDVSGFTSYCDKHGTEEVMAHLQMLMDSFEEIAARHGLEKIKTIGDAFMATAGLLEPLANPVLSSVRCALEMVRAARALPARWNVHVGIHVGPVIAGVVGRRKYLFDVWGDTVNTASRVTGLAGTADVYVSEAAWRQVQHDCQGQSCGRFQVKGKGEIEVFRVESA